MHALAVVLVTLLVASFVSMGAQAMVVHGSVLSSVMDRAMPLAGRTSCASNQHLSSSSVCTTCTGGYKCNGMTQTACGVGYYAPAVSTTCTQCPAGSYCSSNTQIAPTLCPAGTSSNQAGATSSQNCQQCNEGTFSAFAGATSCCSCCAGFYSSSGSASCTSCPSGMTSQIRATQLSQCNTNPSPIKASSCTQTSKDSCPATAGLAPTGGTGKRNQLRRTMCSKAGFKSCPVQDSRNLRECVDVENDLESCGGCMDVEPSAGGGVDCTAISGALDVRCKKGSCVVSRCAAGYDLSFDASTCIPNVLMQAHGL